MAVLACSWQQTQLCWQGTPWSGVLYWTFQGQSHVQCFLLRYNWITCYANMAFQKTPTNRISTRRCYSVIWTELIHIVSCTAENHMAQLHALTCMGNVYSTIQHRNQWQNYILDTGGVAIVAIIHQQFQQPQNLQNTALHKVSTITRDWLWIFSY